MVLHGEMSLSWRGNALFIYVKGPLNIEAVRVFSCKIQQEILNREKKGWVQLVKYSPCSLGGPDVVESLKEFNGWTVRNGCLGCAVLITCAPQRMLYNLNEGNTRLFNTEEDAYSWLATLIDNIETRLS